jgi:hypothetical protein
MYSTRLNSGATSRSRRRDVNAHRPNFKPLLCIFSLLAAFWPSFDANVEIADEIKISQVFLIYLFFYKEILGTYL